MDTAQPMPQELYNQMVANMADRVVYEIFMTLCSANAQKSMARAGVDRQGISEDEFAKWAMEEARGVIIHILPPLESPGHAGMLDDVIEQIGRWNSVIKAAVFVQPLPADVPESIKDQIFTLHAHPTTQ